MTRPFAWLTTAPPAAKRALLAASLGWMLDSFDVLLYALVLPAVMATLHLSKTRAGILGSFTLVAAAVGGLLFGMVADRFGRTRALVISVLLYAVFTGACGLAWSFASLAVFRILLGFGMGGEWATGAALVAETWSDEHRSKALGLMQSSFAVGYALAALVALVVMPLAGWRGVFFVGLLPALLTLWVRRNVEEPAAWTQTRSAPAASGFGSLFRRPLLALTLALTAMNACCMFAWWGFNLWVPSFLSLTPAKGGIGFAPRTMTLIIVVMQTGMWLGYVSFGYLADAWGRKRTYVAFLLAAAALLTAFAATRSVALLLVIGPVLAFAATGYYSGFAAVTAEVFPTRIRATAQGLTYNTGRLASAAAPFAVGSLAETRGFASAFHISAAAFLLAALLWFFIPETRPAARRASLSP